jgi:UDP-N-acetylmuramyl pentapeptide phosphotransferase/UDP-N-acetylglucosamine-1-phosphate transferase
MTTYLSVYLGSAVLALVITPILIKLAHRIQAVDRPGVRTVHTQPMPRIGGVAIFLSAMFLFAAVLCLDNVIGEAFRSMKPQLVTLFCSASFVFLIGLVDDLRGLPARFKLMAELLAGGSLCLAGVCIFSVGITRQWTLSLGFLSWPITLLWIVGVTNAVNLSDGLDGLAAGVSAVACAVIAVFAIYDGNLVMAVLMLALLGSLSGFLFFNFNPAKIFMGDCGSLFVGFTVASASVLCTTKSAALVGLALPVLALGIPIFDTLLTIVRRFLERRSIFAPDRRHFHHRLMELGLRQRHVVISIYAMTLLSAGLGLFMMVTREAASIIVFLCILLLLLLVFRVVGSLRLGEIMAALLDKYQIARRYKREQMSFDEFQLHFRNARTYQQWWAAVCHAAQGMDFAWLSLKTRREDGTVHTEVWRTACDQPDFSRVVLMTVPLDGNGSKTSYEFEIAVPVNGSYESAGHRATLFARLIDEHRMVRC